MKNLLQKTEAFFVTFQDFLKKFGIFYVNQLAILTL